MTSPAATPAGIVAASTRLAGVPYVPGIRLHQADEPFAVWEQTEKAAGRHGLPPPFWAFAWAGGQALARYVLDHPAVVAGRRVLDVAAGSGLVAIAAARSGASEVTAVDVDELAIAAVTANAAANGVEVTPVLADLLAGPVPAADVILCGDAFYEKDLAERMVAFLERARAEGTRVLVGDPGRAFLPAAGLTALATYEIPVTLALEGMTVKRATVYTVLARGDDPPEPPVTARWYSAVTPATHPGLRPGFAAGKGHLLVARAQGAAVSTGHSPAFGPDSRPVEGLRPGGAGPVSVGVGGDARRNLGP